MLELLGKLCLMGAVVLPLLGAIISLFGGRLLKRRCRVAATLAWVSTLLAISTAIYVGLWGPFSAVLGAERSRTFIGLWANQLTVTLLTLICTVGALVQSYSLRYHQGDRAAPRLFGYANLVIVAMAVVCTSVTVSVLGVAWVCAGVAFVKVVGFRPELPGVKKAAHRMSRMFAIGDSALVMALAVVYVQAGNVDLASTSSLRSSTEHLAGISSAVAVLIMVAVLTRSAQGPFGGWLIGTISAPTPTSALLHAGVVNGGGILLVRLASLTGDSGLAMIGIFIVAAANAVIGAALMVHKADVKGSLVYSTMAQMGFMVAECSVGAYLAAIIHLVGHALYKAAMFFGSGSQIARIGQLPTQPIKVIATPLRMLATLVTVAATLGAMIVVPGMLDHRAAPVLLVFVSVTVATASWSWWSGCPASGSWTLVWTILLVLAGACYGFVLALLGRWIAPALPLSGVGALNPWWLILVIGASLLVVGLTRLSFAQRFLTAILVEVGTPPIEFTVMNAPFGLERRLPQQVGVRDGSIF